MLALIGNVVYMVGCMVLGCLAGLIFGPFRVSSSRDIAILTIVVFAWYLTCWFLFRETP